MLLVVNGILRKKLKSEWSSWHIQGLFGSKSLFLSSRYNYIETFSLVVKLNSIIILYGPYGWIWLWGPLNGHKIAFLNDELEYIYMNETTWRFPTNMQIYFFVHWIKACMDLNKAYDLGMPT
jgi:hypothetical protein